LIVPMPPFSTGVSRQAKWVNWESTDTPMTSVFFRLELVDLAVKRQDF